MNTPQDREETIFEAALRLPQAERGAFLRETCRADPGLRERMELLLKSHEEADENFLRQPPHLGRPGSASAAAPLTAEEALGTMIGRYKLLEKIGEGGFGVVYVAEQREPVKRQIALKIIKLGMDTKQVVARFEAERQALALMDHPNIAKVFDAGATETGRPYFVMELVRGIRITDYCDHHNLSIRERLELFAKVCQAIQHAHQKGIIHRDIKPSNLLVTLHDGVPVPKVIDFGIAKATQGGLTEKSVYTQLQQFIGTPAYMSPEQANLSGLDVDTRTDVYSLGVLLYELLTGKTPFDGRELLQAGLAEMRRTICEQDPARPSTRLRALRPADLTTTAQLRQTDAPKLIHLLRGDLDWIVMKCLEKDRTRRYETTNGLALDVQRHLKSEPVIARPPSTAYRFQKLYQRNRLIFAAAAAVAVAVLVGLGGVLWQWRRAEQLAQGEARQRLVAEARAAEIKLNLYASDINLASQAIQRGNFGGARRILAALKPGAGEEDLRGFEWRYLWNLCQGDQRATLTGHEWIVSCAVFSPDGKLIATGSQDRTVKIWDAARLELVTTLNAATGDVWSVAFSPDGRRLITAGRGGTRLWNTETWELMATFPGQVAAVSKTGSLLAVSESSPADWLRPAGTVSLWNYDTGAKLREWARPAGTLAFSPDGRSLAVAGIRMGIDLLDLDSGKLLRTIPTSNLVWSIAFSPAGNQLVTTAGAREPVVWDLSGAQPSQTLKGHFLTVWSAGYSPDGATIVTTGSDQTLRLWDAATLQLKNTLRGHDNEVWCAAFSPDASRIVTGSKDQKVLLWSAESHTRRDWLPHRLEMPPVFSRDGMRIVIANRSRTKLTSTLWDASDRVLITEIPGRPVIGFSPDGSQVVHWSANGLSLERWSLRDQSTVSVVLEGVPPGMGAWTHQGFSPEGEMFFTIDPSGTVRFWNAMSGRLAGSFYAPTPIQSAALGPGGKHLALGAGQERVVRLHETSSGRERQLAGHRDAVNNLAFSPDGAMLASCSRDGAIRLWDTVTGRQTAVIPGHLEDASGVAFSPDGRTLASINARHAIKLWHVPTGRELLVLDFPQAGIFLQFSPDGRRLAATTGEHSVRFFDAPAEK